ncbi:class I adenylate-forming enzyme family protein [Nocardia sp. NPDC057663]|uniref:class I adenylate-forming enzyme family protein n=1 Tax=Nocardia sp. NPDC057663 TaxID=3346201 RepID=UPI00366BF84D
MADDQPHHQNAMPSSTEPSRHHRCPKATPIEHRSLPATLVQAWNERVRDEPDSTALIYFDGCVTVGDLDTLSNALAIAFQARGLGPGKVVGIYLQNIPAFVISLLAAWKVGAAALLLNPMYRRAELRRLIDDSRAVGLICRDVDHDETRQTVEGSGVGWILTTCERDFQSENDPRAFPDQGDLGTIGDADLTSIFDTASGEAPTPTPLRPNDLALLCYTSGTTGPAKGSMATHRNILAAAQNFARWQNVNDTDRHLAVAPLFHITGAVASAVTALLHRMPLVLINRTRPELVLDAIRRHRVTTTIGSITVFNAVLALADAAPEDLQSLRLVYSGGAPIPPATIEMFARRFGIYIHNVYGMTETASTAIAVPAGAIAPTDPGSATLAIGVPMAAIQTRIVGRDGVILGTGGVGELQLRGPQITPGYLGNPQATAEAFDDGWLRTGDAAMQDDSGWIYLVDRIKDQINVSGFKVWPREVEDILYEHPAVREAAVIGEPDPYRGEIVVAFVSLNPDAVTSPAALLAFASERLAAYKKPRTIRIVDELPKTATGKIQRRELNRTHRLEPGDGHREHSYLADDR